MSIFDDAPYLSNFYKHSFWFAEKKWSCIDEVYEAYRQKSYKKLECYKDLETILTFCTYIKFSDHNMRQRLMLTLPSEFDKIKSEKLRERLKLVKGIISKGESS